MAATGVGMNNWLRSNSPPMPGKGGWLFLVGSENISIAVVDSYEGTMGKRTRRGSREAGGWRVIKISEHT